MLEEKENVQTIINNKLHSEHNTVNSQILIPQPQTNSWDYFVQTSKCLSHISHLKSFFCNCKKNTVKCNKYVVSNIMHEQTVLLDTKNAETLSIEDYTSH